MHGDRAEALEGLLELFGGDRVEHILDVKVVLALVVEEFLLELAFSVTLLLEPAHLEEVAGGEEVVAVQLLDGILGSRTVVIADEGRNSVLEFGRLDELNRLDLAHLAEHLLDLLLQDLLGHLLREALHVEVVGLAGLVALGLEEGHLQGVVLKADGTLLVGGQTRTRHLFCLVLQVAVLQGVALQVSAYLAGHHPAELAEYFVQVLALHVHRQVLQDQVGGTLHLGI